MRMKRIDGHWKGGGGGEIDGVTEGGIEVMGRWVFREWLNRLMKSE